MGLVGKFNNKQINVPLKEITARVVAHDTSAVVEVVQKYHNDESERIEAFYSFPLYEDATVVSCVAEFHNGKIECVVKEKESAEREYNDAKESGKQAALMREHSAEHYDVSIGNMDPSESVTITIKYLTILQWDLSKKAYRFTLPTTITPRYDNRTDFSSADSNQLSAYFSGHLSVGTSQQRSDRDITYGKVDDIRLSLDINCVIGSGIKSFSTLPFNGTEIFKESTDTHLTVRYKDLQMDKDFVAFLHTDKDTPKDYVMQERYKDGTFTWKTQLDANRLTRADPLKQFEFIFVVDQSASMAGSQINHAKRALHILINSLPQKSIFNVYGFGSRFYTFFQTSVDYNEANFKEAKQFIDSKVNAEMGGTELNAVMEHIYNQSLRPHYERRILLLTDGEVWNVESLFKICKRDPQTRVYTIGIGNAVSHLLVEGLAKCTNGNCEIVTENELIEEKCVRQMTYAMSEPVDVQIGKEKMRVYPGNVFVDHRMVEGSDELTESHVEVTSADDDASLVLNIIRCEDSEGIYPLRLRVIKEQMDDLSKMGETESAVKQQIVNLSCQYNILTKFTAFVGILEGERGDVAKKSVTVPLSAGKYAPHENFFESASTSSIKFKSAAPLTAMSMIRGGPSRVIEESLELEDEESLEDEEMNFSQIPSAPPAFGQSMIQLRERTLSIKNPKDHHAIDTLLATCQNFDGSFPDRLLMNITEFKHSVTDTHGLSAEVWYTIVAIALMMFLGGTIESDEVPFKWRAMYRKAETFVRDNGEGDKVARAKADVRSMLI